MKKINCITLILLLANIFSIGQTKTDWDTYNLKSKVKKYTEAKYIAIVESETIKKGSFERDFTYEYDENGNEVYYCYNLKDCISQRLKYDDNGKRIEENLYNPDGTLFRQIKHKYNEEGYTQEMEWIFSDGTINKSVFTYTYLQDENGNLIKDMNQEAKVISSTEIMDTNIYRSSFNITYNLDGSSETIYKSRNINDEFGFPLKELNQDRTEKSIYDKKDRLIARIDYLYDGRSSKVTYIYDNENNLIEKSRFDSDENLEKKVTYKYDENGNRIEEITFDSNGSIESKTSFKYEYDDKGNWIKAIEYEDGIAKYIEERTIVYW